MMKDESKVMVIEGNTVEVRALTNDDYETTRLVARMTADTREEMVRKVEDLLDMFPILAIFAHGTIYLAGGAPIAPEAARRVVLG